MSTLTTKPKVVDLDEAHTETSTEEMPEGTAPAPTPVSGPRKKALISAAIAMGKSTGASEGDLAKQEKSERAVAEEMLHPPGEHPTFQVEGIKMRRFSVATISMLKRIDSPLIKGLKVSEIPNVYEEIMKLIVLQSAPIKQALAYLRDPIAFEEAIYEAMNELTADKTGVMTDAILEELRLSTETQVEPEPEPEVKGKPKKPGEKKTSSRRG